MSQQHPELSPSRASLQQLLRARLAGPAQHPCSFGQQRLWFLERLAPGLPTYNLPVAAQLEGPLDEGALLEELRQLVRRHEILRTTFAETAEGVVQRAAPGMDADVELVDLSGEGDAAARALVEAEALRPFDLAAGPPFRARVIRCAPDRHFLLLCQHHITGDAASVGVLLRELSAGYAARVRGDAQPAPPRLQYADFAEWERRHLRGPDRERLLAYWRERLAGVPTDAAHRPAGAPRGPGRSARHPFELTPEATAALAGLAREEGSTTSMPVLAGFAALLSRFTERRDLVIGVPVSGRTRSEFEETVGFFVNTLPVRIRLEGNPTFREALRRVRDAVLGGVEHQEMPLDLLVQELRISSEGGGSPLVQVAFSPADEFPSGLELPGIVSRAWWPETGIAKFDLFLRFTDDPDGAGAALLYDTNLFDAETIARLAGQLVALLGAAAADPDRRIADVPLLSPEERERVVVEWNRTAADFPRGRCVHDLFAAQAALTPDALALDGDSGALSYGQLETRANRLAHLLRARGVGVETRVGVLLERGPELIVALLAVLKAGGAYVPLDPEYPAERLAFMLRDSGAALLVSDATLSARGADLPCAVVRVDDDALDGFPATPPAAVTDAENLAYVVYTSGSTGTPKGVMVSHEALANLCAWHARAFDVGPDARATLVASVGFDASAWELWPYLMRGASVRAVPAALRLAPAELGRWMETERVTHAFLPTPLAEALLAESTAGPSAWLLTGGDRMRRAPSAREFRVANNYGPTESTVVATSVELRAGAAGEPPIGRPIANTRGYVLDSGLQPVPIGAWGELYLGGAQLARGYLARPALTAASFVPDPFSGQPGARLYRTGDRVRWTAEGVLEFGGRVDEQVKVRGHRIEPGEVEAALLSHPDVAEAAVAALGEGDEKRLVAYVVPRTGAGTDAAREHLRERLPAYMVPSAFVVLDRLPLTPNGKVDRRALPAPSPGETRTAPRTPTEEVLAGIWCDVLGVERVGMEDDFFELGGHSMRAMRIAARVGEALGVEVPLRTLFEHSTLAALAARADVLRRGGEAPARIQPRRDGAAAPLSFGQERLYFLQRLAPESTAYHVPTALRLAGDLDLRALADALAEVVRRHEILRSRFAERDGAPVQLPLPPAALALEAVECSEAELADRIAAELRRPFDLAAETPLRATVWKLGARDHVLLLCVHHAATDGWSQRIVLRELERLYAAFRAGEPSPLPEPHLQYADFAAWQRGREGEVEAGLAYWRERLAGSTPLELPADGPRGESAASATVRMRLPEALADAVARQARAAHGTAYMVLLAAWQALLARWTGQDDVIVASPVARRARPELEEVVGFFVDTLPLRTDVAGDPTARELLGRVREVVLGAYAQEELPLERVAAVSGEERGADLFRVAFSLHDEPSETLALPGITSEAVPLEGGEAKFDLLLTAIRGGGGVELLLEYRKDLLAARTAEALLARYARLLEQMVADPFRRLSRLELLSPEEHVQVVADWNRTSTAYPRERCVHELFAEHVALTPHATALDGASGALTYAQLDTRANRLAHLLRARGVREETRVGMLLERGPELIVALLAILKAGGAYVPLDPEYPPERLGYMLRDSGAALVVSTAALAGRPEEVPCPVLHLDEEALEDWPETPPESGAGAESLAYIIYTSGSTGTPKGVMVPHRGIVRLVRGSDYAPLAGDDRVAQLSSASFDAATWELWAPLTSGAALVFVPRETLLDPRGLAELVRERGVTTIFLTTALFHHVARHAPGAFGGVRRLLFGGEQADPAAVRAVLESSAPERILHVYGPTENTTYSTWHRVERVEDGVTTVPIGRAIAQSTAYVLDPALRPVPVGVWGELYVGGDGVARGYRGRTALTAERFVPDEFSRYPGARMYRTGDRVRWTAEGVLEFGGRFDQQVKIRGYRIEPGEIEAALLANPEVAEAVVVLLGQASEKRLVAYVVARGEADLAALRADLRERLPAYMLPAAMVALDRLPITANGKLDRRALPHPEHATERAFAAPRTPEETALAAIWAEVLGVERVGVEDGFFELGGHSLLAMRVVARAEAAFGVELPLRAIFDAPTVAGLAERIAAVRGSGPGPRAHTVERVAREGALAPSFGQERFWFLRKLIPDLAAYHVPLAYALHGALDADALDRGLAEVVRRHEVLRTRLAEREGRPVQEILPAAAVPLVRIDLRHDPAALQGALEEEAARAFDFAAEPPVRLRLWRTGEEDHVLLVCVHHVATDGWSTGVLLRELAALYAAFAEGRPSPLPDLPVQYADYAAWQRAHASGDRLRGQLAYWRERLDGLAPLQLATDRPRPPVQGFRGGIVRLALEPDASRRLHELAGREGATLYMVLLAAWQALLAAHSGSDDVAVATPVAGRSRPELEGLIGFFVNTLVLRTGLGGDPTFRELLARAREAALGAFQHQDVPFERLVEELQVERHPDRSPLAQVMFALQNLPPAPHDLAGVALRPLPTRTAATQFDLSLAAAERAGALDLVLEFNVELFDAPTAERILERYARLLAQVAAEPGRRLSRIDWLSAEERAWVLAAGSPFAAEFAAEPSVPERIAERARLTPDAPAVEDAEGRVLTYGELNARANGVAHTLRGLGLGPGAMVAVCMRRSPELAWVLLGVLKAGAAYVPVDPDYPRERVEWMLEDTAAPVVITQSALAATLPPCAARVLIADAPWPVERAGEPENAIRGGDLAYVIYTSGSTGRPKGVMVQHDNLARHNRMVTELYALRPTDRVLQLASISFDVSVEDLFPTWIAGGTVVLAPATVPALGAPFTRWVRERGITLMNLPTAFWHGWVGLLDGDGPPPDGLRLVVVGGERAHPATWARWRRWTADRVRTINAYGPTETTVLATWFEEEDGAPADESREVPIGTPVAIARVYVLDPWLRPLPAGVPGELYIAGEGVSRGYHGAPGLTACRFLPDPFAAERGARMYRTGDRGRWRADGRLEITGRTDAQVKIRGFRVEPGEVETALAAHPLVAHSAVHPQRDPLGRLQLVAYVVPAPGARASADEMRAWLGERLPAYMLPAAFVELERIPLLPGGKVDHRALPAAPFHAAPAGLPSATRTQLERAVAEAWCQVLGRERVGVHENFFELGGHSLLLVQLQQELEERAGRRVPLLDLFAYPTVGELAAHLDRASAPEPAPRRSEGRRTIVRRRRPSGGVEGAGES